MFLLKPSQLMTKNKLLSRVRDDTAIFKYIMIYNIDSCC